MLLRPQSVAPRRNPPDRLHAGCLAGGVSGDAIGGCVLDIVCIAVERQRLTNLHDDQTGAAQGKRSKVNQGKVVGHPVVISGADKSGERQMGAGK